MNNLVIMHNKQAVTTSLVLAEALVNWEPSESTLEKMKVY